MDWPSNEVIRVLHVDDDVDFADLTATFLEREDERLTVETAPGGNEGLDRLADDVDCIVSDYDMPEMNGIEFLRTVRETHPDLPFVLFTGTGSEEVASDAISAGVTDYLRKEPGTSQYAVLANRIGNAVGQYRSENALEASRQRLSLFVEQSPLGVLEFDERFEIVGLNPAGEEILGYSAAELRGRTWEVLVPPSDRDEVAAVFDAIATGEGGLQNVNENVRSDGERIVCEWHNRVVTDDDGDVVAVFSQFQDVTDRQRDEEHLRRTTAWLEVLFEESPDMIDIHDADGTITEVNARLSEVTGYDESELVGMNVWDLDETVDPAEGRTVWERMAPGERHELDGVYTCRDGSTVPVEVHIRRIDRDGRGQFVVISRDVSERIARERRLEAATTRYRALVENFPDGWVCMFDDDLAHTLAGGRGLADAGFSAAELLGAGPTDLFPDAIAAELRDGYRRALAGTECVFEHGYDGEQYRVQTLPVTNDDGEVVSGMAVSQNVTEQRRRQRQLNRQNERLEEFAGVVSHDLRNPLAIAEGYLELARANPDPDHFDRIEDAHRRMRVLIEDLLLLAQEGREGARGDAVDLADVVETSWQNVETDGARLVVETSRTIRADRTGVQQLLENLVRNAVEHGSTGARAARRATDGAERDGDDAAVAVTVGDLDGEDGFYVADDGPGIPPADRTVVFERGHTSSETGTGLGLYIVEQVVDRHGWDVRVAESDDGGARFEISGVESVPEADGESMTHDRARSRPDPPDGVRVEGREPE